MSPLGEEICRSKLWFSGRGLTRKKELQLVLVSLYRSAHDSMQWGDSLPYLNKQDLCAYRAIWGLNHLSGATKGCDCFIDILGYWLGLTRSRGIASHTNDTTRIYDRYCVLIWLCQQKFWEVRSGEIESRGYSKRIRSLFKDWHRTELSYVDQTT